MYSNVDGHNPDCQWSYESDFMLVEHFLQKLLCLWNWIRLLYLNCCQGESFVLIVFPRQLQTDQSALEFLFWFSTENLTGIFFSIFSLWWRKLLEFVMMNYLVRILTCWLVLWRHQRLWFIIGYLVKWVSITTYVLAKILTFMKTWVKSIQYHWSFQCLQLQFMDTLV